jgi:hypothetical protein
LVIVLAAADCCLETCNSDTGPTSDWTPVKKAQYDTSALFAAPEYSPFIHEKTEIMPNHASGWLLYTEATQVLRQIEVDSCLTRLLQEKQVRSDSMSDSHQLPISLIQVPDTCKHRLQPDTSRYDQHGLRSGNDRKHVQHAHCSSATILEILTLPKSFAILQSECVGRANRHVTKCGNPRNCASRWSNVGNIFCPIAEAVGRQPAPMLASDRAP